MPPFVPLWDPKDVLESGQKIAGVECVGYAKTKGRRCRNHIARADYQVASKLLVQMSRLNISAPGVDVALAPLARLLLCHYWDHQDQVEAVVAEWRKRIQNFQAVAGAHLANDAQTEHNAARQEGETAGREWATARREIAKAHLEKEVTCREIERLRRDVATARQETNSAHHETGAARWETEELRRSVAIARQEARTARRDAVMAHQETEIARRDAAIARQENRTLQIEAARNLEARNDLAQQIAALSASATSGSTTLSRTVEDSRPNLAPSSTRHPERPPIVYTDIDAAPISSGATSRAERQPTTIPSPSNPRSMPTGEDSNLTRIDGECTICLHDLGDEQIVRCAAQCQQPFHGECIDAWLDVRRVSPLW